ncbi:hypothetical protein OEZ86_010200 [Tetradesmus obliquus]|nr:hypothetical protein OEZ86_010200 [Tetradesmus obliquus]
MIGELRLRCRPLDNLHMQLPQHVAFIPDGNRRFAAQLGLKAVIGHYLGNKKLKNVVHWCRELGIRYVTIYAFSTDNFKRSAEEVARLMKLARAQFEALVNDEDIPMWRAEVRVIGDLPTLPPAVAAAAAHAMTSSQERSQTISVLNVSFSYTSSQDLHSAVQQVVASVEQGQLLPSDITPGLLQQVMHTRDCPPVDLLIRTSGEQRLSDFLLWQSSYALLHWERCLWPEFG